MLKVEIIGNIGNDAEIKEFGGKKYVSFSVAHTEYQQAAINVSASEVQLCGVKGENVANAGQVSGAIAPQVQQPLPQADDLPF